MDRLRDQGLLSGARAALGTIGNECPAEAQRLAPKRDEIQTLLGGPTDSNTLHRQVRDAWRLREAGDVPASNAIFSRALEASLTAAVPRLAVLPAVGPAARLDSNTLVFAAQSADESGALFVDVERRDGTVKTRPFRFVPAAGISAVRLVGPSVMVRGESSSILLHGAAAPAIELPPMDRSASAGSAFAAARLEGGIGVFDAATGAARGSWENARLDASQRIVVSRDGNTFATCSGYRGDVVVMDAQTGSVKLHESGHTLASCVEDLQRDLLHLLIRTPTKKEGVFDFSVRSVNLLTGKRLGEKRVTTSWDSSPYLWTRAEDGSIFVDLEDTQKRHFKLGKPPSKHPLGKSRLADRLPTSTAQSTTNLGFLSHLSSPPWSIMESFMATIHTWTANGVLSPDGKTIAVLESKEDGEMPAVNLLVADADTLQLQKRIPLGNHASAWTMVEFLDDTYATVRFDWDIYVVHTPSGTLRSRVGASDFYDDALVLSLGDDLALAPPELIDLAMPITQEETQHPMMGKGPPGLVTLPFSPSSLSFKDGAWADGSGSPFVLGESDATHAPPWVLCVAGEHVLPGELCEGQR